jgi:hypothetical protein
MDTPQVLSTFPRKRFARTARWSVVRMMIVRRLPPIPLGDWVEMSVASS